MPLQPRRTRTGVSWLHGGHVVSTLPARPGPTHSIFDLIAAAVAGLAPCGRPVAMLGFAGGGTLAPLRALGCDEPVSSADLDVEAVPLFREVAGAWAGEVSVERAEATAWLLGQKRRFGAIIDDLSIQVPGDVVKPDVSTQVLPALTAKRLARGGVGLFNLIPSSGSPLSAQVRDVSRHFAEGRLVRFDGFENGLLIVGAALPESRTLSANLKASLERIGSKMAGRFNVRRVEA